MLITTTKRPEESKNVGSLAFSIPFFKATIMAEMKTQKSGNCGGWGWIVSIPVGWSFYP